MPIRLENKDRYPPSWREISLRIRDQRAKWRCECTGQCGLDHEAETEDFDCDYLVKPLNRCQADKWLPHPVTNATVILTVAHLDHRPENCEDANLVAMCQRCHNRYDAPERRRGIEARARARRAIGDLFDG